MSCTLGKFWDGRLMFSNEVLCVRLVRGFELAVEYYITQLLYNYGPLIRSVNSLIPYANSSPIREIASGLLAAKSASRSLARVANSCTSNVSITLLSSLPLCLQRFCLGVMNRCILTGLMIYASDSSIGILLGSSGCILPRLFTILKLKE